MARILLLGADRRRLGELRALLRQDRHDVVCARELTRWRAIEREVGPELVVAAMESPDPLLSVRCGPFRGFPAPLLFLRNDVDFRPEPYLDERLVDQISGPFLAQDLLTRIDALVRVRRVIRQGARGAGTGAARDNPRGVWRSLGRRLAAALRSRPAFAERPLGPSLEVAARVADWADRRDSFKPGHAERVAMVCAVLADELEFDECETSTLLRAAALHDIGKVALPVEVLHQVRPLEESQRRLIRTHPKRGAALLRALDPDEGVAATILYHHEAPDGSGYYGMSGTEIPRTARVLAIAEVFDAMTNSRLREPVSVTQALDKLDETKGELHDRDCAEALSRRMRARAGTIQLSQS